MTVRGTSADRPAEAGAPVTGLDGVVAAVVTHRRPRLAGDTVRRLVDGEGLAPGQVVVVVNAEGGLDDPALEAAVRTVRLPENLGPAGGFRRAMEEAFAEPGCRWAYLCEDDMTLLGLPTPRLADVVARAEAARVAGTPVGAVVAFGRRFVARSGHSVNVVPPPDAPGGLAPVDVTTWGATLVSRAVADAGVWPDDTLFFGFEDFDFYCRLRAAGFDLLVDVPCARAVAHLQTSAGRDQALAGERPVDAEEPWRAYYFARNFFELARRHGRRRWLAWHLLYSLRRLQLAGGAAERRAILTGLVDGARGRLGADPRYGRTVGERAEPVPAGPERRPVPAEAPAPSLAGTEVVALVLSHNAPASLARCLDAIEAQTVRPGRVVVVDNASEPPVPGDLSRPDLAVEVVRSESNGGPAGGWALALARFSAGPGEAAWILDDDMRPDPDCLERLTAAAGSEPKALHYPRSVQPDGSVGLWPSWCGVLVPRAAVDAVGLPRPELFWWAEDTEYLHWRIPQAGFPPRVVDGALVQHDAVRQDGPRPLWKYYYEARNMLYLHLHVMRRVGWYPRNVTKLVARAAVRERGRRLRCLAVIARGLADGARGRLGIRYPVVPMQEKASGEGTAA